MLLFVYGSLRRGEPSHAELGDDAQFVAVGQTDASYELVDLGSYPALLEGGSDRVTGELFEVSESRLPHLDWFEDVPTVYERKTIRIGEHQAQCYIMPRERAGAAQRIASCDWCRR